MAGLLPLCLQNIFSPILFLPRPVFTPSLPPNNLFTPSFSAPRLQKSFFINRDKNFSYIFTFKFYTSDAQVSQFDYANNTLRYNLLLNFTARNPNKKLGIYYDDVEATALYQDERFSNTDVITFRNSFRQDKKMTHPMSGVFSGQQLLPLDPLQVSQYNKDKLAGAFDIDVKLKFEIRFRLGNFITGSYRPKVWCGLRIPLSANGTTAASGFQFQPTKCRVDF